MEGAILLPGLLLAAWVSLAAGVERAGAQDIGPDQLVSRRACNITASKGYKGEPAVAVNPLEPNGVFVVYTVAPRALDLLEAALTEDAGKTWRKRAFADGNDGLPKGGSMPSAAYDKFGNLFVAYVTRNTADPTSCETVIALSANAGGSFRVVARLPSPALDLPVLSCGPGPATGTAAVYLAGTKPTGMILAGAVAKALGDVSEFKTQQAPGLAGSGRGSVYNNAMIAAPGPAGNVLIGFQTFTSKDNTLVPAQLKTLRFTGEPGKGKFAEPNVLAPAAALAAFTQMQLVWNAADGNGPLTALYPVDRDVAPPGGGLAARMSCDGGLTWKDPQLLSRGSPMYIAACVDAATGRLWACWQHSQGGIEGMELQPVVASAPKGEAIGEPFSLGGDYSRLGLKAPTNRIFGARQSISAASGRVAVAMSCNAEEVCGTKLLPNSSDIVVYLMDTGPSPGDAAKKDARP